MGKTEALQRFTQDLTEQARAGKIDPVLGRDEEIRQLVDILLRRRQNNPILVGEAGVGKTAVVEGFAMRLVQGDVPPPLKDVSLRALDVGLLQAGASMKGEFEERLKSVIAEIQASPTPIILFIDEAHTLIGAGGAAGTGDAANLLKPALARGTLRTIAATTWAEYKKFVEPDAALTRRFQTVKIDEPSTEMAVRMMRGVAPVLEQHHQVTDAATQALQLGRGAVAPLPAGAAAARQVGERARYRLRPGRDQPGGDPGRARGLPAPVGRHRGGAVAARARGASRPWVRPSPGRAGRGAPGRKKPVPLPWRRGGRRRRSSAAGSWPCAVRYPPCLTPITRPNARGAGRDQGPAAPAAGRSADDPGRGRRRRGGVGDRRLDRHPGRPHGQERDRGGARARRHLEGAHHRSGPRAGDDRPAHPDLPRRAGESVQTHRRVPALRARAASARPRPPWRWPRRCMAASRT